MMDEADVVALSAERDAQDDTGEWLRYDEAEHQVCLQAHAIGARLGHDIRAWTRGMIDPDAGLPRGRLYGLCIRCLERAIVAPRAFREPPLRGIAVQFECRPRR